MYKLKDFELLLFLKQLRILLAGGNSVANAIELMIKHTGNPRLRKYLLSSLTKLQSGKPLYEALFTNKHPFPKSMARCFKTMPEKDHEIAQTIRNIEINYQTRMGAIKKHIDPALSVWWVIIVPSIVLLVLLIYVVPTFASMFKTLGGVLPLPTRLTLLASDYWYVTVLIFALIALLYYWMSKLMFRFKEPYVFSLIGGQLESGADIKQALRWSADSVDNPSLEKGLRQVLKNVENGETLSKSFRNIPFFPPFIADIIALGEKKGDIKTSLNEVVSYYTFRQNLTLQTRPMVFMSTMIVFIIFISFSVWSLYLPIFRLITLIK